MICGVDEAGKGAVFGPMVVGVVGCEADDDLPAGVRDSKTLTPRRREALYTEITGSFPWQVVEIPAAEIDRLREEMTMNDVVARAHAEAVRSLGAGRAFLDACDVDEERYRSKVAALVGGGCEVVARHHGDALFPVVSAASIVAKVTRDRALEDLRAEYGAIGSGYPSDKVTIAYLKDYVAGHGTAPIFARTSWETVARLFDQRRQTSLGDF
ncbi:ribonuclease HII [Methanofollis aquaemaris]|uniref:Ribonuclease HII n=1 Tax=Methanofollis aquaemaris TaxID=126734 RepID=A0A8A3S4I9_9EURY|nr:ribonuclease HII [Methanofollis aquaemaris]QSZ66833.1 ribonuclease HII [Methanofollis aquaemaris]